MHKSARRIQRYVLKPERKLALLSITKDAGSNRIFVALEKPEILEPEKL